MNHDEFQSKTFLWIKQYKTPEQRFRFYIFKIKSLYKKSRLFRYEAFASMQLRPCTPYHIYGNILMVHTVIHHLLLLSMMCRCIGSVYETQTYMQHITAPHPPKKTEQKQHSILWLKHICMFTVTRPILFLGPYPNVFGCQCFNNHC